MTVTCTHCSSRYVLPPHLVGPQGARVRCPVCGQGFVVSADGTRPRHDGPSATPDRPPALPGDGATDQVRAHAPGSAARSATPPERPIGATARGLLHDLDHPPGTMARAAARRSMFSEFGPRLLDAFERCRAEAGPEGEIEFRRALADVTGVDFEPLGPEPPRFDP